MLELPGQTSPVVKKILSSIRTDAEQAIHENYAGRDGFNKNFRIKADFIIITTRMACHAVQTFSEGVTSLCKAGPSLPKRLYTG